MKTLKVLLILTSLLIAVAALVPCPYVYNDIPVQPLVLSGLAVVQVILALLLRAPAAKVESVEKEVPSVAAPVVAEREDKTEAELVHLLGLLQEKGRFVDFVMDDITPYGDAQIAAAARVVHQGCQKFVKDNFAIEPVTDAAEGSSLTLEPGYKAGDFRLLGNVGAEPPHTGTLLHRGWRVTEVSMSRLTDAAVADGSLPVLAPAEVEVK